MHTDEQFTDFYELMQISPNAERETILRVYRLLAARYHPDNPETGDVEKFLLLKEANEIFCDPQKRAAYDAIRCQQHLKPIALFSLKEFAIGVDGEANRRLGILCLLYHRRRTNPEDPSLSLLDLEGLMAFPREHLLFAIWYLSEKMLIRRDDNCNYQITAEGIDSVESSLPSNRVIYGLLKSAENGETQRGEAGIHPAARLTAAQGGRPTAAGEDQIVLAPETHRRRPAV